MNISFFMRYKKRKTLHHELPSDRDTSPHLVKGGIVPTKTAKGLRTVVLGSLMGEVRGNTKVVVNGQ